MRPADEKEWGGYISKGEGWARDCSTPVARGSPCCLYFGDQIFHLYQLTTEKASST